MKSYLSVTILSPFHRIFESKRVCKESCLPLVHLSGVILVGYAFCFKGLRARDGERRH